MSIEKIVEQVQQLKKALEEFERRLLGGEVPTAVMEDFKMAVDHTRMTIWALLSAPADNPSEITASLIRFRLKRTVEMCRQIVMDIDSAQLTVDSPELLEAHAKLKDTLQRIDRLFQSGI